jgi:hypothetical protein
MTGTLAGAVQSFYSGTFYGELARRGRGIGMRFILLLTLVMLALYYVAFRAGGGYDAVHAMLERLPEKASELPSLTVADGKLSIDRPVPYKFDVGLAPDDAWIVIDTNYKITDVDALEKYMRDNNIIVLLTADKVVMLDYHANAGGKTVATSGVRISDIKDNSQSQSFSVTHADWQSLAQWIKARGMAVLFWSMFTGMLIGLFILNFLAMLFSAVAVMILDLIARNGLEFPAAMRLAAAARIPVTVISALPLLVGRTPLEGGTGWLLWLIYLVFAVWAVKLHK